MTLRQYLFKFSLICFACFGIHVRVFKKVIYNILDMKFENLEIIIVDDGSTDGSYELLNEISKDENIILLSHKKNYGKGYAIRTALEKINNEIVIIQDADLEYNPKDYPALLLPFKETNADIY